MSILGHNSSYTAKNLDYNKIFLERKEKLEKPYLNSGDVAMRGNMG